MLSIFMFLFLPTFTFAAEFSLEDIKTTIEATPKNPRAYENVFLTINSSFVDTSRAEITWSLDGKIILKGIGAESLQFKTGASGKLNKIGVVIKTLDGKIIYKDLVISPSDVDLLWEAYTYTPPFYKGKALDTQESLIKIVAIPQMLDKNGNRLPVEDLVYKWKTKGELRTEASGFGKNILVFRNDIVPVKENIEVEVSSVDNSSTANESLILTITDTKPIIYENNPLLGILFNKALLNTVYMGDSEMRLSVFPFFFSALLDEQKATYSWKMNGVMLNTNDANVVFIKPVVPGLSKIELKANGIFSAFQRGSAGFTLDFSDKI